MRKARTNSVVEMDEESEEEDDPETSEPGTNLGDREEEKAAEIARLEEMLRFKRELRGHEILRLEQREKELTYLEGKKPNVRIFFETLHV